MKRQIKLTEWERIMVQEVEVIQKIEVKACRSGWNVDKRHRIPNICLYNIFISHGYTELVGLTQHTSIEILWNLIHNSLYFVEIGRRSGVLHVSN
jgi:hypothetical protein